MPVIIRDATALRQLSEDQNDVIDTIDDLRSMGVGRDIDLPQLIVVGDQSSGKSSVLEAISLVRFPVRGGLCTRFATELILRKAPQPKFKVSIIAADSSINPGQIHDAGVRQFNETEWDDADLDSMIEAAKQAMGIGNSEQDFSDYILRIEISRPEVPSLTLIDLPGFYHGETSEQSASGRNTVNELARQYMKKKSSIILAVISGSYGLANQKVLNEARKYDPEPYGPMFSTKNSVRTLGILTKPDTIAPGTDDEEKYLQLIQNKEAANKLDLGWHVLRNRAGNETSMSNEERDIQEAEFFNQGAWKNVRPGDKGIKFLRSKLSKVLVDHIKKSLPSVRDNIERSIEEKHRRLKELGTPRSSPDQIRQYLCHISDEVQRLARDAVRGTGYIDPFFGDLHSEWSFINGAFADARKLRAVVRNLNQTFTVVMETKGETRSILWDEDTDENDKSSQSLSPKLSALTLEYKVDAPKPVHVSRLEAEMRSLALENLGSQFPGSPNDYLAVQLFKDQSQKWGEIAQKHLDLVSSAAKCFMEAVLKHVIPADNKTREAILVEIVDPFFQERELILKEKLQELLHHYKMGIPQPFDSEFQYNLSFRAKMRLANIVKHALAKKVDINSDNVVDTITSSTDKTNEYTKVIDMMVTYYRVRNTT